MMGWIVATLLLLTSVVLAYRVHREREKRIQQGAGASWPIRSISLPELDPVFTPGRFGPTLDTEVTFIGRGPTEVPGGTSDAEAWILAVLAKRARRMFEFGTCTGKTTYLWASNAAPGAEVATITLAPEQQGEYVASEGDDRTDTTYALRESAFADFLYSGTPAAASITQLFGDSKAFDETPYLDWADLVFVDGSHARSYVESDSRKAMRIAKPGGLVLWHDYAGPRHAAGVYFALNELAKTVALHHVRGTTFVAWRRPG
jgi:hypothetical protein